ncbi:XdhC family protein [Streptomyces sp. MP131-18]|uniref:XdhC family protein n=1 Tax=Streptomyces sp. MP131-18 TaxID=1857892 RepID=UPI0009C4315F|nr:putative xanthine dehydrogenase subunit A [Streptomyces sp. MP131-18]
MWEQLHRLWEAGTPCGLATVVSTFGSAPRRPGAIMICTKDGTVDGSVSGGCVEGAVHDLAQQAIKSGTTVLERYGVSDDDAGAVGLTCGGTIEVLVERIDRRSFAELGVIAERLRRGTAVAIATLLEPYGSARAGAHLVCWAEGTLGTIGSLALDGEVSAAARRLLARGRSGTFRLGPATADSGSGARVFVNCLTPPPRLLVYGAGDFAAALIRQGALLGHRTTLCDARPAFTFPERFPGADEVIVAWPHRHLVEQAAAGLLDHRTAVVSLTHDPKFEIPLLDTALRLDLAYVGALGSHRSIDRRTTSLRAAGLPEDRLARLHAPIGLDLGGSDPAETALSIAAEMVLVRHGARGTRLSETTGPIHRDAASVP